MLSQQSGSEHHNQSFVFKIVDASVVGEARRFAQSLCGQLDYDEIQEGRLNIIINELGSNLVKYAKDGKLILRSERKAVGTLIEVIAVDSGPGFPDAEAVMKDGFTTGSTPGTGLGAAKRQADEFEIYSVHGKGTIIVAVVKDGIAKHSRPAFSFSAVSEAYPGEHLCGDGWCVSESTDSLAVIMVDGLGHGPQAHKASVEAVAAFAASNTLAIDQSLVAIHNRLKSTRGAAVFLLNVHSDLQLQFSGLGNIRSLIQEFGQSRTLISQNGTAGLQMRTFKTLSQAWSGMGVLILHSDGIKSQWDLSTDVELLQQHPAIIAASIHRDYNRHSDDSSVLVIRRNP